MDVAQIYFRENGIRGTVINGPFRDVEEAQRAARAAGFKSRDIGFLRKEGANISKIELTTNYSQVRQTG